MNSQAVDERKNKLTGLLVTLGVHALLILLAFIFMVFTPHNPPLKKYGEARLGFDATGLGESFEASSSDNQNNQEFVETPLEAQTQSSTSTEENIHTSSDPESVNIKASEKSNNKNSESTNNQNRTVNSHSLYNPNRGENKPGGGTSGPGGTEGRPDGSRNGSGVLGSGGLNMPGWTFENFPNYKDFVKSQGVVKFKVVIDEYGEIKDLDVLSSPYSQSETDRLKTKLMNDLKFRLLKGGDAPMESEGTFEYKFKY